jgi:hypothetical protein
MINNGNATIQGNNLNGKICGQAHKNDENALIPKAACE